MKRSYFTGLLVRVLSILIIMVTITFSWFSNYDMTNGSVGGDITIDVPEFSSVSANISIVNLNDFTFKGECVSSNGYTFYGIDTDDSGTEITGYHQVEVGSDEYNLSVFEFQIIFTTYSSLSLYLSDQSYVTPKSDSVNEDLICGAVRFAFLYTTVNNDGVDETHKMVWAPNSYYKYNDQTEIVDTTMETSNVENNLSFVSGTSLSSITNVSTSNLLQGFNTTNNFIWGTPKSSAGENIPVFSVASTGASTITVTVRIWIEGTDREAVKALVGGKFYAHLNFLIIDEES